MVASIEEQLIYDNRLGGEEKGGEGGVESTLAVRTSLSPWAGYDADFENATPYIDLQAPDDGGTVLRVDSYLGVSSEWGFHATNSDDGTNYTALNSLGLDARRDLATRWLWAGRVIGDALPRFHSTVDGQLAWGDGAGVADTNLYRSAANTLKTDDSFVVSGTLGVTAGGHNFLFYDTGGGHAGINTDGNLAINRAGGTYLKIEPPGNDEVGLLVRVDRGGVETVDRVSIGAVDSGGAGFRALRVPN